MKNIFIILIFCFFGQIIVASDVFVWQQSPDSPKVLMPKKSRQTYEEAVNEYFQRIHAGSKTSKLLEQKEISPLLTKDGDLPHAKGKYFKINNSNKTKFVIVTNELRELYGQPYSKRMANFKKRLEASGAEVFMLPVMHDITLNAIESKIYRDNIIDLFDAQLIMGGADIDPFLYGEKVTFAKSINRARDVSELKFVKQFINKKKGMNFGICRGHQMCAVAHHKKLIQDIQIIENASDVHLEGEHFINYDKTSEVFSVFDEDKMYVNSLHHQSIVVADNDAHYRVIATSLDTNPIVEGIEFKSGLGVTLQFHPELMHDETGDKILKKYVQMTEKQKNYYNIKISCTDLMKSFI